MALILSICRHRQIPAGSDRCRKTKCNMEIRDRSQTLVRGGLKKIIAKILRGPLAPSDLNKFQGPLFAIKIMGPPHRVFSLNFWWGGGLEIFGPRRSPMGGGDLRKKSDWSQNCPLNAKLGLFFCYFKHEIQLFKVLLSLKVVKFDTKMYLNFSNFRGRTSAGGDKPWSKNGDKCRMGGDW